MGGQRWAALLLLCALLLLPVTAYAQDITSLPGVGELLGGEEISQVTDAVPPQAAAGLEDKTDIADIASGFSPAKLIGSVLEMVRQQAAAPLRAAVSLCAVMILCSMLEIFHAALSSDGKWSVYQVVVAVSAVSITVTPVVECILEAAATLRDFSYFIITFIPVLAGVMTASGQPLTAAAYNIFLFWLCQTISSFVSSAFVPLLCAYLALAVVAVVCPTLQLGRIVNGIKTFAVWMLCLGLTIFVGLLSMQSLVAGNSDSVSVKAARFMIGSLIPGVGGVLSELFVAAQGCIQVAKGVLGAFGVVVTLLTFLPILIKVGLWYVALSLSSVIGTAMGVGELAALLKNAASTLGLLLAALLCDMLLVTVSTTLVLVVFHPG